ncbi:hypothetical protein [Limnobacter parvus]|uniref:Transmembrane protein n=1 Tax=Limnobacter parvus TaxID=2939690 RepID=A0ABT1XG30_9BURK|nr:hypothetical protein [Limnobacter parvus]MCR2745548.1 hypothetical protein [Limnobacter parvus]
MRFPVSVSPSTDPRRVEASPSAVSTPTSTSTQPSRFTRAARRILKPALMTVLLGSSSIGVLPALQARRHQATVMPGKDLPKYLPSPNSPIRYASGVMIHNAGSDIGRSDTSVFLSNQHQSTVAILESLPALGAQMDPYKQNGVWYLRHQFGDGSAPLRLADELREVNEWLDNNPDRIFVLDLDTFDRLDLHDVSLAEVVRSCFGSKVLMTNDGEVLFTVKDAVTTNKRLVLSARAASIPGFAGNVDSGVVVQPLETHAANLTPVYSFLRGIAQVDRIAFDSTPGTARDHFETPQDILEHVQQPGTQILLDQMNLASFIEPKGFESDPVFMSGYPESETLRKATLGATTGSAMVSAFAALALAALATHSLRKQSMTAQQATPNNNSHTHETLPLLADLTVVQLTSAISNCALTLATVFPGLRHQLGAAGLVSVAAGFIAKLAATRVNPHALNAVVADDVEQQAIVNPLPGDSTGHSAIKWLADGATAYHVLTRFASLAKYSIPATLPALAAMNFLMAVNAGVLKLEIHNLNAQEALRGNPENRVAIARNLKKDLQRQGLKTGLSMAGMAGSMGIVVPAASGPFLIAAALTPIAAGIGARWLGTKKARELDA